MEENTESDKNARKNVYKNGRRQGTGNSPLLKNCNSGFINITESKARKLRHSNDRVIDWCYNIYRLAVK